MWVHSLTKSYTNLGAIVLRNLSEEIRQANAARMVQRRFRRFLLRKHATLLFQHWRYMPGGGGYNLAKHSFLSVA